MEKNPIPGQILVRFAQICSTPPNFFREFYLY